MTETLQLPEHLSYSQVTTLLTCGEQYRLQRLWGLDSPAWYLVGGSALHVVTQQHDLRSFGEDVEVESFEDVFERLTVEQEDRTGVPRDQFRAGGRASKRWPNKENRDWWLTEGPVMVDRWLRFREASPLDIWVTPAGRPAIELSFRLELPDLDGKPFPVYGEIDRVMVRPNGSLVVVDIKSGSTVTVDEQVGLYRVALEQAFGVVAKFGAFWSAREGTMGELFHLNEHDAARAAYRYGTAKAIRDRGLFVANPGRLCGSCGVRAWCYAVNGELANEVRRPWVSVDEWEGES